jgi:hypothetical protein
VTAIRVVSGDCKRACNTLKLFRADVGWVVLVGGEVMQLAMQRAVSRESSAYFHAMIERCRAKAASANHPEDRAYWLGLAEIWGKLAERGEE